MGIILTFNTNTCEELLHEVGSLVAGTTHEAPVRPSVLSDVMDAQRAEGYKAGAKDGREECAEEIKSYTRRLNFYNMLPHDRVMVTLRKGHLPFPFYPQLVTTFGKLSPHKQQELGEAMIGTPRDTVGIYGTNQLGAKPMFLTDVDHWTLAPAENKS